jgi:hypothetical protein
MQSDYLLVELAAHEIPVGNAPISAAVRAHPGGRKTGFVHPAYAAGLAARLATRAYLACGPGQDRLQRVGTRCLRPAHPRARHPGGRGMQHHALSWAFLATPSGRAEERLRGFHASLDAIRLSSTRRTLDEYLAMKRARRLHGERSEGMAGQDVADNPQAEVDRPTAAFEDTELEPPTLICPSWQPTKVTTAVVRISHPLQAYARHNGTMPRRSDGRFRVMTAVTHHRAGRFVGVALWRVVHSDHL